MIQETQWIRAINQLVEYKHIWACKNGKCFIMTASRTHGIGYNLVPMSAGLSTELPETPMIDNEEETRTKVAEWLNN